MDSSKATDPLTEQVLKATIDRHRRKQLGWTCRPREGFVSLLAGTLSLGLGGLLTYLALVGVFGHQEPGFSVPYPFHENSLPPQYVSNFDGSSSWGGQPVRVRNVAHTIFVPEPAALPFLTIGICLGVLGLASRRHRGDLSVLSAIGLGLNIVALLIPGFAIVGLSLFYAARDFNR